MFEKTEKVIKLEQKVEEFNKILETEGSTIRLKMDHRLVHGVVDIALPEDHYVDNFILNVTDKFYTKLKSFFGYAIHFNNTGSCFWL